MVPVGAYRLRLSGLDGAGGLLGPAPGTWPELAVERTVEPLPDTMQWVSEDGALVALSAGAGWVRIDRAARTARFITATPVGDTELLHPFLSPVAAVFARWQGWTALHGGAFVVDGGAWALLGERGSGKSSTLAWLCTQGAAIVADDLLVLHAGRVAAGPRCLDLRPDAAEHLDLGHDIGVVGTRARWRAPVGPVEPELPLRGWVQLAWGDDVSVAPVRGAARLSGLLRQRALFLPDGQEATYLKLATLPTWRFVRPQGFRWLPAIERMVERITRPDG